MKYSDNPVDMSKSFKENGNEYCRYLITDTRSDVFLNLARRQMDDKELENK